MTYGNYPYQPQNIMRSPIYPQNVQAAQNMAQIPTQNQPMTNYACQSQNAFTIIPVASFDEANAIPTDFSGSTIIMPDFSHGMIYTKTLDVKTGNSVFLPFKYSPELLNPPVQKQEVPEYDAKGEIEKLKQECAFIRKELGLDKNENS